MRNDFDLFVVVCRTSFVVSVSFSSFSSYRLLIAYLYFEIETKVLDCYLFRLIRQCQSPGLQ